MKRIINILIYLSLIIGIGCNKQHEKQNELTKNKEKEKTEEVALTPSECGGSYGDTYSVINSYYIYPLVLLNVSCADSGATITINVSALDVPNRFSLLDQNGNYLTGTGWLGNASYSGYWGPPFSNNGQGTITFNYNPHLTYFLKVQTQTPPNTSYNPSTDGWAADVSCTCGSGGGGGGDACACDSSYGGSYDVINSYYVYPYTELDFSCLGDNTTTITINVSALDVPNRFSIVDQNNNYIAGTNWLGSASYSGYWGSPFSNNGQDAFTFTRYSTSTYYLRVETQTPPNTSYNPSTDGWWVGVICD